MKLRSVTGFFLPILKEASVCEACGGEFVCGASMRGCWCTEIKLTDEMRADLKSKYKGCLCRKCLEELQEKKPVG